MRNSFVYLYKSSQRLKRFILFFFANLIGVPIGVLTSVLLSQYLGSSGYGDYKFIISVFNFVVTICAFGFFQAGDRAMVLSNDKIKSKEYYGALLVILCGLFVIVSAFLSLYALFDSNIQEKNLQNILLRFVPFSWVFLFSRYFEALFQADNQMEELAKIRVYPQLFFFCTSILLIYLFEANGFKRLDIMLATYLATQGVIYIFILYRVRISLANFKIRVIEIWKYNKSFGFNLYLGTIFSLGFAGLTEILISYFGINNEGVGFYSLATAFAMPIAYIPNTIAITHYKKFSTIKKISSKLLLLTISLSIASLFGLWLFIGPVIRIFYGKEFEAVTGLFFIVSTAVFTNSLGDFFNSFLRANGQGRTLRNILIVYGIAIMTFNLILISKLGTIGAAYSQLITSTLYLIMAYLIYLKFKKNNFKAICL